MAILANPQYFEQEHEGNVEQVLVAVRYVGPNRKYSSNAAVNQGRFPNRQAFLNGQWYVAFVPETLPDDDTGTGIAWFERSAEFDVAFEPERIAEVLLERNYVSLAPGGPIGEGDSLPGFDAKVEEGLGLDDEIEAGASYEEQLEELAGVEEAPATEDLSDEERLVQDHDRGELKDRVEDAREDADEFSLRGVSMEDMAEFLVSKQNEDTEED